MRADHRLRLLDEQLAVVVQHAVQRLLERAGCKRRAECVEKYIVDSFINHVLDAS